MTRWDPWRDLFVVPRALTQYLTDGASGGESRVAGPAVYLPLDIRQTKTEYVLEASVPGFRPEEIEVVGNQGTLTIRGERKVEAEPEGRYLRRERRQLSFFRQISLPAEVRESEITARFENGILSVHLPRLEAPLPTRIRIDVGSANPAPDAAPAAPKPAAATSPA